MNFVTKLLQSLAFIPSIVTSIEDLFNGRSGSDKKDAALTFLESAVSMGEAIANRQIVDEDQFRAGLTDLVNGTVKCLNASVWSQESKQEPIASQQA